MDCSAFSAANISLKHRARTRLDRDYLVVGYADCSSHRQVVEHRVCIGTAFPQQEDWHRCRLLVLQVPSCGAPLVNMIVSWLIMNCPL